VSEIATEIESYLKRLFPITRSITGEGNRKSLNILQELAPIHIKEYPSGTSVYDWIIPEEWNVQDAWIQDDNGNKIVDFKNNNIHLVSYSEPVNKVISFEELKEHLHFHDELPNAIPYRTTYYKRDWGFCVTQAQYKQLEETNGLFNVYIDSEFNPNGSLTIGEILIPGKSEHEILISTYICHPSLANDNLSGAVMTAFLARELLKKKDLTRSYRIVWVPETIGAITYCAMNESKMKRIQSGLMVTTVGGPGKFGYKQSYNVKHSINSIVESVFEDKNLDYLKYPFDYHGSDDRQYSSQGFRINMISLTKDKYYEYKYYHTSLDNLDYVKAEYVTQSLELHLNVLEKLNHERVYQNCYPNCEVMLSKHDLYPKTGGGQLPGYGELTDLDIVLQLLWVCDGSMGVYGISNQLNVPVKVLMGIVLRLQRKNLLCQVV
jgi:aminopeptidase-like protein